MAAIKRIMTLVSVAYLSSSYLAIAQDLGEMEAVYQQNIQSQRVLDEYWTTDAMEAAIPEPLPEISESEIRSLIEKGGEQDLSKPPVDDERAVPDFETFGTPSRADLSVMPFKMGGRLFYTKDGKDYYCSAQFTGWRDTILSAAHCLRGHKTGNWITNVVYRHRYKGGSYSASFYNFPCMSVWSSWVTGRDSYNWKVDYGFLQTARNNSGYLGYNTAIPSGTVLSMGYPRKYEDGEYMQRVTGTRGTVSGGVVQIRGAGMGGGSSGGAWRYGGYTVGLNSFHYVSQPGDTWGPDINSDFVELLDWTHNGCP